MTNVDRKQARIVAQLRSALALAEGGEFYAAKGALSRVSESIHRFTREHFRCVACDAWFEHASNTGTGLCLDCQIDRERSRNDTSSTDPSNTP